MTCSFISRFTSSGPMMILLFGKLIWCRNHDWTAVTTLRLTFQRVSQSVIQSCFFLAQLGQLAHFTNSKDSWWLSVDHYQMFANYQSNLSTNSETFQLWDYWIFLHSLTPSGALRFIFFLHFSNQSFSFLKLSKFHQHNTFIIFVWYGALWWTGWLIKLKGMCKVLVSDSSKNKGNKIPIN